MFKQMKAAGLSKSQMALEVFAGLLVFAIPASFVVLPHLLLG
jgi:hypothetical protein